MPEEVKRAPLKLVGVGENPTTERAPLNLVGLDDLKKKVPTELNTPSSLTSESAGSTSELAGTTSGVSPLKTNEQPTISSLGSTSFADLAKSPTPSTAPAPYVGNKDNYIRRKKMEDTLRKNAASNPDLLKTPGIEDVLYKKIINETSDDYLANSLKQTLKSLKRESDVLNSESDEPLDVMISPANQGILENINKANTQLSKESFMLQGKTEEEADVHSKVLFPEKETTVNSGLNMDKVKKDYLTFLFNNDKENFDNIRTSANVGGFNDKKSMKFMQDALVHQNDIIDSKINNILSDGIENLTEEQINQVEQFENQKEKLSNRFKGVLLEHPDIHKEIIEGRLAQQKVDDDYKAAKAKALLPSFEGEMARAEVLYRQVVAPIGAQAVKLVGDLSQFALHQVANFTPDEKVEGLANIAADWANGYFDTEKEGSIFKKPTALKGALFEDKTLISEGGFKPEKLLPKVSETLFQMYALLGGGSAAGGVLEAAGMGTGAAQKIGLITSSFGLTQNDYYQEAKEAGLSNNEANNFGNVAALLTSTLELINPQGYVFGKEAKKGFTKSVVDAIKDGVDMRTAIKQNSKFIVKELIGENIQEVSQELGDLSTKYLFNKKNEDNAFDINVTQNQIKELVMLTSIVSGLGSSHGVKGRNQLETESLWAATQDIEKFNKFMQSPEIKEQFSEEEIIGVIKKVGEYKKIADGLPETLDEQSKIETAKLVYAKNKLKEQQKEVNVDDVVAAKAGDKIQSQIDEINGQIEAVFDNQEKTDVEKPLENFELNQGTDKVEYKINDKFFSEQEIISNLGDEDFVKAVKEGNTNLVINNPTPLVSLALQGSGLLTKPQLDEVKTEEGVKETPKSGIVDSSESGSKYSKRVKGGDVETGTPVTLNVLKNTEKAPNLGSRFGQDVEPSGNYITQHETDFIPDGWKSGEVSFKKPLVIDVTDDTMVEWKRDLSKKYKNKKGNALTEELKKEGYDGIITRINGELGEIIAFDNSEQSIKETPVTTEEVKEVTPPALSDVESTTKALSLEDKSIDDVNSFFNKIQDSKNEDVRVLSNMLDNVIEKKERNLILNNSLDKVSENVDAILSKDSFVLEKSEGREVKSVAQKYMGEVSKKEAAKDFKDAFFGNPSNDVADALKMRESVRVYTENGGAFKDLLSSVKREFDSDGFTEQEAASVIKNKLEELSKKDFRQQQISEAYHKAKADGSNPELVKAVESLLSKEQENAETTKQKTDETKTTDETIPTEGQEVVSNGDDKQGVGKEEKPKKIKQTGRIPLDRRGVKDKERLNALAIESDDLTTKVMQWFISGNAKVSREAIETLLGSKGEVASRASLIRNKNNGGKSIDGITHDIWKSLDGVENDIDSRDIRDIVEDVIRNNSTRVQIARRLNKIHGQEIIEVDGVKRDSSGNELFETPEGLMTQSEIDDYVAYMEYSAKKENADEIAAYYENITDEDVDIADEAFIEAKIEEIDAEAKSQEKISEKPIQEKFKSVADNIRKLKSKEIKFYDKDGNEIVITKQGLDWNDLVEKIAVAVEKTGDVAAAISDYLSDKEWFNNLSDENKVAVENQIKESLVEEKPKKESPTKQKTSKTVQRLRLNELDPEEKERLKKIGNYDPLNIKEYNKAINELIDMLGVDVAIEYADSLSDNLTDGSAAKKKQVYMTAASLKLAEAQARKRKAVKEGNLIDKSQAEDDIAVAYSIINDATRIGTAAGQLNAIDAELHKQFPSLYMINALNHLEKASPLENSETFKDEKGNSITVEQAINNLRDSIAKELRKDIEAEFGSKIEDLKNKIEELKKEKPVSTEQKKREIKKSIDDKWAKFKKAGKISASASLIGLNSEQIEILGSIIVDYIKLGGINASSIIKKVAKEAKAINKNITEDHIENIARDIHDFNELISSERNEAIKKAAENNLTEKEKDAILKKAVDISGKKILDIAKDHYVNRRGVSKTLAQSLIDEAGLDIETAKKIAENLENMLSSKIEERVKKELDKFLESTDSDVSAEKRANRSKNKKLSNKIVEAINLGALNNGDEFQKAFEKKFGFRSIDPRTKARLNTIIEELTLMENNNTKEVEINGEKITINTTKREDVLRKQREFNTLLESSTPLNYALILNEINGAIYISILSDPTSTSIKALVGSAGGTLFGVSSETLKNPIASFLGIVEATKSTGISIKRALTAYKTGIVEVGKTKTMGEFSTDKQGRLETALFQGLREAVKDKRYKDVALSIYGKTLKNIRILAAMDAFLVSQTGIYYNTISERGTRSEENSIDEKIKNNDINIVYKDIASEEFSDIKKDVESEVDFDVKNGIVKESKRDAEVKNRIAQKIGAPSLLNQKSFYESKRIQELKENQNYETFQKAWNMGQYFSLVGKPDGYIGIGTSYLQGKLAINKDDSKAIATSKFAGNMLLKFVNLMGNFYNATASSIPILGIANAFFGAGYNPITGEYDTNYIKGKLNSNKKLVYTRVATNAIITALTIAALFDQLDYDDEEEEYVLNPDRAIDFRGSGFSGIGGYTKNSRVKENYEPFSFSWTKDANGNFTNYHNFNNYIPQLNAIVATVSAITDDLQGMKNEKDIIKRSDKPIIGYSKEILDQNLKGFLEGSFNSMGRAVKPFLFEETFMEGLGSFFVNTIADNMSPLLKPNSHVAASNYIKSYKNLSKKKATTVGERLVQNLYGLDRLLLDDKVDAFGNPYPQTNDVERFITEVPKMSELYPKTTGLLFKFEERGLDISKWRNSEMKPYSNGFSYNGRKYIVKDSDIKEETIKLQEELFNKYVSNNYSSYIKISKPETLERLIKGQQDRSKRDAKREIVRKYVDKTDKNAKIMVID